MLTQTERDLQAETGMIPDSRVEALRHALIARRDDARAAARQDGLDERFAASLRGKAMAYQEAADMARQLLLGAALHDRRWSTSRKLRQAYRRRQAERRSACDPCREGTH